MASSPITSWQIDGETMETVTDFISGGSKITADGDCSHEIKRLLLLGRKAMTNPESILKSRDVTLPKTVCLVKAIVFPVVMYGCESWTIKKAQSWRIDAFELWCWRGLLGVPWTARRSNQSVLREINLEYLLEGLMLKLKLQYFGHLMQRTDSLEKSLMLSKRASEVEMPGWHYQCNGHNLGQSSGDGEGQEGQACWSPWGHKESDKTGRLNNNNSACKLNKQGDNIRSWHTPFPILNQSAVLCKVLIGASWPAYRFLRR